MSNTYKFAWFAWWLATVFVIIGTISFEVSSKTKKVEISLVEGQVVDISILRILPHPISLEFRFSGSGFGSRPELGEYKTIENSGETGVLHFKNPGEPIKISVTNSNQNVIYETLPASGYGPATIGRELVVYENDNNPSKFSWPLKKSKRLILKSGINKLQVTILNVSKSIAGEKVFLEVKPPLGFKSIAKNYKFLYHFYLWPVYGLILISLYIYLTSRR